jgi:hypothetical protein
MSALAYMRRRRLAAAVTGWSVPDPAVRDERASTIDERAVARRGRADVRTPLGPDPCAA